jgi:hypothetical protein
VINKLKDAIKERRDESDREAVNNIIEAVKGD